MRHGGRRLRVGSGTPDGFARVEIDKCVKPGGWEGVEVATFLGGKAAFFIGCCPEPPPELIWILIGRAEAPTGK